MRSRAIRGTGFAIVLAVASACSSAGAPPATGPTPTNLQSTPTPYIDYTAGLPGPGEQVEVTGEGFLVTVLQATLWPEPAFLADVTKPEPCLSASGDEFVAVEIRVTFRTEDGHLSGLNTLVGPPRISPLASTEHAYRTWMAAWCTGRAWDDADVPTPYVGGLAVVPTGDGREVRGWLLFAVRPDVAASQQLVLLYVPEPGADGIEIRLE